MPVLLAEPGTLGEAPGMRVLVTGATGFVGSWVARELVARGHEVRALIRPTSALANLEGLELEQIQGDVTDLASVERALRGCQAVVHSAGAASFRPGEEARREAVNHAAVGVVLGAALRAGVRRAVLTSSVAAMGGTLEPALMDEAWPTNAESLGIDYFVSKLRGEREALRLAGEGLPVSAVRPGMVLGPGDVYDSSATLVLALARRRLPMVVRGGASFCDVRDVARGHAEALERGRPGEVYILGGHNLEVADMAARASRLAGVPAPRAVPSWVALATAGLSGLSRRLRGRKAGLSRQAIRASRLYTFVSSEKARRELGYSIRPLEESLADTLRWFMKAGRLKASTPELAMLAARETEDLPHGVGRADG
ncbi:MAG TPA: NAD-dependent epimerase/dehydratase family protein [Anaeromyxobacteraceae bacterium]|nr:NAD-dependent epimerase/dehydratase family protein [Anaeromyxobacteraceae bacterium]